MGPNFVEEIQFFTRVNCLKCNGRDDFNKNFGYIIKSNNLTIFYLNIRNKNENVGNKLLFSCNICKWASDTIILEEAWLSEDVVLSLSTLTVTKCLPQQTKEKETMVWLSILMNSER